MARYLDKICGGVKVTRGILFDTLPGYDDDHKMTPLYMDVYEPECDLPGDKMRRALIFVHGGGFVVGTRNEGYPHIICETLAQYGYVCFTIDYRMYPSDDTRPAYAVCAPVVAGDVERARAYICANAEKFGIDPEHMSIAGGSAGAMAALDACKIYPEYKAFISLWGTYENAEAADKYPPTFLLHGTADQLVPYAFSAAFLTRLQKKNIPCTLFTLENGPHTAIERLSEYEQAMIRFLNGQA